MASALQMRPLNSAEIHPDSSPTTAVFADCLQQIPSPTFTCPSSRAMETPVSSAGFKSWVADTIVASKTVVTSCMLRASSGIGTLVHIWRVEMKTQAKASEELRTGDCKQKIHSTRSPQYSCPPRLSKPPCSEECPTE